MNIKESFEHVGFTPEEKMDLTARLTRAAEQEENMTSETKRKIKKISGGMIFGIAAAVVMTAGALAAVISPGLHTWFDTTAPGASEALEDGICRLNRSETYNGWTVTLEECAGDDSSVYIWVDVAAPEGTSLALPEYSFFYAKYWMKYSDFDSGGSMELLPDEDPDDNRISFLIQHTFPLKSLRGETVDLAVSALADCWWEKGNTPEESVFHEEGTALTAAIRDHVWTFEDVKLDFPDQTIRLAPNVEVPWLEGSAMLTKLEVSPFNVTVRMEGGSCGAYVDHISQPPVFEGDKTVDMEGITITMGAVEEGNGETGLSEREMLKALTVELTLRDGTVLAAEAYSDRSDGRAEGIEGPDTPFVELALRCAEYGNYPSQIWDPAQVDHVTVCGVDIPVNSAPAE